MISKLTLAAIATLAAAASAIAQTAPTRDTSFHTPELNCAIASTGKPAINRPCLVRVLDSVTTVSFGDVAFQWSELSPRFPTFSAIALGQVPVVLRSASVQYTTKTACASGAFGDGRTIAVCYNRSVPVSGSIND